MLWHGSQLSPSRQNMLRHKRRTKDMPRLTVLNPNPAGIWKTGSQGITFPRMHFSILYQHVAIENREKIQTYIFHSLGYGWGWSNWQISILILTLQNTFWLYNLRYMYLGFVPPICQWGTIACWYRNTGAGRIPTPWMTWGSSSFRSAEDAWKYVGKKHLLRLGGN